MSGLPTLSAAEQRLVGCLLEKERTVPASYPLTLNALRTACNQTSSRDPVVDYDERLVEETARELKQRGLVRIVWSDTGRRTLKYHQILAEQLELADDERALLTVLLLRGPQAPGELRSRAERLHQFPDRGDVEETLRRMAAREDPLVEELPRRYGERDNRWRHLLGEAPALGELTARSEHATAAGVEPQVDLTTRDLRVRHAYDLVATSYAETLVDELQDQPFEQWLLQQVADLAGPFPVVEAGCGPGHVTAYLAGLGVEATGVDQSPAMVAEAASRFPDGSYQVADFRSLLRPVNADGWGAVLAWYSLIHHTPGELSALVEGLVRPLRPGGWLVGAFHAGQGVRHVHEWLGHVVDLDVVLHDPAALAETFSAAGLTEVTWYQRSPLMRRGESTERCYVLGRRPEG